MGDKLDQFLAMTFAMSVLAAASSCIALVFELVQIIIAG